MRINTNVMALNAQNMLSKNQNGVEKSVGRLSSGLRINGASDDAAGLAISEKMRAQMRGLNKAQDNTQDGISLLQTAEGALQQTTDILQRMRELVIKAQNTGVLTEEDKASISNELGTLRDEIDRIGESTTFNGKQLLNGKMGVNFKFTDLTNVQFVDVANARAGTTYEFEYMDSEKRIKVTWDEGFAYSDATYENANATVTGTVSFRDAGIILDYGDKSFTVTNALATSGDAKVETAEKTVGDKADFKIGANTFAQDILSVGIADMTSIGLNRTNEDKRFEIDISSRAKSDETLQAINYAINKVSAQRAALGTVENRMEYASNNLSTTEENLTAAESRIRDVDMAEEMVTYTKNSILNESAMAMLAQANKQPETILTLLQ